MKKLALIVLALGLSVNFIGCGKNDPVQPVQPILVPQTPVAPAPAPAPITQPLPNQYTYTAPTFAEMTAAAANLESLNNLYKSQLDSATRNAEANKEIAENASKLKEQMQSMTANIATLNNVYGGMLSAMSNRC